MKILFSCLQNKGGNLEMLLSGRALSLLHILYNPSGEDPHKRPVTPRPSKKENFDKNQC